MTDNTAIVREFSFNMGFDTEMCNNVELQRFKQIWGTILMTLTYKIMAITPLLYGPECWTERTTKRQIGSCDNVLPEHYVRVPNDWSQA